MLSIETEETEQPESDEHPDSIEQPESVEHPESAEPGERISSSGEKVEVGDVGEVSSMVLRLSSYSGEEARYEDEIGQEGISG